MKETRRLKYWLRALNTVFYKNFNANLLSLIARFKLLATLVLFFVVSVEHKVSSQISNDRVIWWHDTQLITYQTVWSDTSSFTSSGYGSSVWLPAVTWYMSLRQLWPFTTRDVLRHAPELLVLFFRPSTFDDKNGEHLTLQEESHEEFHWVKSAKEVAIRLRYLDGPTDTV